MFAGRVIVEVDRFPKRVSFIVNLRLTVHSARPLAAGYCLLVACLGLGLNAAGTPPVAPASSEAPLETRLNATWIAADFDGNSIADFVTASAWLSPSTNSPSTDPMTRDGQRYQLAVHLDQAPDATAATFSPFSTRQLLARDVDGDADVDLVLETLSSQWIAVWINDGNGHFREADIEHYRQAADVPEGPRFSSTRAMQTRDENFEDSGPAATACETTSVAPALSLARLTASLAANPPAVPQATIHARGPPRHF
jgi:hypothetical protein